MKSILTSILFFSTTALFAQLTASTVLDQYLETIGGQSKINQVQSIYSLASCRGPNGPYQTELYSASDSKTIFKQKRARQPDYTGLVNGDFYWTNDSVLKIADRQTAFVWRSHELQWIATHLAERFQEMAFAGTEIVAGKEVIRLTALDELQRPASLYFDASSHLLFGFSILNPFSKNEETILLTIQAWKKTGKLLLPSKATFSDKQGEFFLNFETIQINQVDPALFQVPEKIMAIRSITELQDLQRTAHFKRDAAALVAMMSDDYTEIRNGKISKPAKEQLLNRFQDYFNAVTFIEWDDIREPVIQVSEDGTLAHVFVYKRVRLKTRDGKEELTIYAWTATYQKKQDSWLLTSITSTAEN